MRDFAAVQRAEVTGYLKQWPRALPMCILLLLTTGLPSARAEDATVATGFSVRKEPAPITEAIEDFERYRDKKAWEKAFAALDKVLDAKRDRLVPGQAAGFFIPSRQKIRDELLTLPADGREAYRLFNDAKAAKQLHDLTDADADRTGGRDTDDETVTAAAANGDQGLEDFVDLYFVTSVGDQAADRLGDSLFEEGNFIAAQKCWKLILDSYPDTTLSPAMLQTKRAIAFESAGQWDQFQKVRERVADQFPGQKVHIAGEDVVASSFLDGVASSHSVEAAAPSPSAPAPNKLVTSTLAAHPSTDAPPLILPTNDTPIWQCPLMDDGTMSQLQTQMAQFGWGSMTDEFSSVVPATAVDSQRMYVNWFGVCFAIDLTTGKMLWRTESPADLPQRLQQMMMQGQWDGAQIYAVALAGDRVLFVGRSAGIQNSQQATTHLLCVDGKTGKPLWKSDKGALANWSFLGRPLVHGDHFYAVAHPSDTQEFNLLTIGLSNGELLSKLPIGTPALGTNMRGMQVAPIPEILEHEGAVYILTNNGGLIATDPVARQVLWAFTYETHIEQQQTFWYNQQVKVPPLALGAMLIDNGTLFIKEYKGEQIYALDLAGPRLDWKRPIDNTVTLAAADGHDLYVVGTEADCIDRDSRDMQWSAKLSTDTSYMQPIISGGNIFVFGERGIQQVRAGDGAAAPIFRGFDRDSAGGCLWQTRDKLVTVSNLAVTAYPVGQGSKP